MANHRASPPFLMLDPGTGSSTATMAVPPMVTTRKTTIMPRGGCFRQGVRARFQHLAGGGVPQFSGRQAPVRGYGTGAEWVRRASCRINEIADAQRQQVGALVGCMEQAHAEIKQQDKANEIGHIEHLTCTLGERRKVEDRREHQRKQCYEDDKDSIGHASDERRGILDVGNYFFQWGRDDVCSVMLESAEASGRGGSSGKPPSSRKGCYWFTTTSVPMGAHS